MKTTVSYSPWRARRLSVRTVNYDLAGSGLDNPGSRNPEIRWETKRILQAIDYIRRLYRNRISPEALSLEVGLSVARLQSGFRTATGRTVASYLEMTRIEASKTLLAHSDTPIRDIAREVGFRTQSHFSSVFKKLTGLTPLQYRNYYGC
jgi:AraC-like DNA-binding protein